MYKSPWFFYFLKIHISHGHQNLVSSFLHPVGLYWYSNRNSDILSNTYAHYLFYADLYKICWNILSSVSFSHFACLYQEFWLFHYIISTWKYRLSSRSSVAQCLGPYFAQLWKIYSEQTSEFHGSYLVSSIATVLPFFPPLFLTQP